MPSATPEPAAGRAIFFTVLLTLALFFSNVFVMVTALPLIYYLLRFPKAHIFSAVLPALLFVVMTYTLLVPVIAPWYEKHPLLNWLVAVPFMSLRGFVSPTTLATLGIAYFGYYIFLAMAIVSAFQAPEKVYRNMVVALSLSFAGWCVLLGVLISAEAGPEGLGGFLIKLLSESEKAYLEVVKGVEAENPHLDVTILHTMRGMSALAARLIVFLQPAFLFVWLCSLTVFNLVLAKRMFFPLSPRLLALRLTRFRPPFWVVWLALALFAMILINARFVQRETLQLAALNILIAVCLMFVLQGLAVAAFLVESKVAVPFMRLIIYLTIMMFIPPSLVILGLLGFADNWLDLRKLDVPPKGKNGQTPAGTAPVG